MIRLRGASAPSDWTRPELTPRITSRTNTSGIRLDVSVVISALQKHIRRGLTNGALFFAYVLYLMKGACRFKLLRRLMVIASEDIGIASLQVVPALVDLFGSSMLPEDENTLNTFCNSDDSDPSTLRKIFSLVCLMSSAEKDRCCDHAIYPLISRRAGLDYEDFRGCREDTGALGGAFRDCVVCGDEKGAIFYAGRLVHLREEGRAEIWRCVFGLYDEIVAGPGKDPDGVIIENLRGLSRIFDWFVLLRHRANPQFLHIVHAVVLLCNVDLVLANQPDRPPGPVLLSDDRVAELVKNEIVLVAPPPDWCFDKHTKRGARELGRGFAHFFAEGAKIENRIRWRRDPYISIWKKLLLQDERLRRRRQ